MLEDKENQARIKAGRAPHMDTLLHHCAYGEPRQPIDVGPPELLNRQIGGLGTLEDPVDVDRRATVVLRQAHPMRHEPERGGRPRQPCHVPAWPRQTVDKT